MGLFSGLYDRVLTWSRHRHAPWYLGGLSFAESSFFPIPPDVLLAPMVLAKPQRGFILALLTTATSVAGGVAGYAIGYLALDAIEPVLREVHYWDRYLEVRSWFEEYGLWAVLLAGFSPIPYKLFTIAAGAMTMSMPLFVLASALGRGARFFLVAALMKYGGAPMEQRLRKHVDTIGWATVGIAVVAYLLLR